VSIYGLRIIFDTYANEATTKRLFPESRYRSERILKKLIVRLGSEYYPALHVAPSRYHLRASVAAGPARGSYARSTMSGLYIAERISA
jgi:hypothetical protein